MDTRPLLISANQQLIEHVRTLADAGGLGIDVTQIAALARPDWESREVLLVGDDLCEALIGLPRRRDVSILHWQPLQHGEAPSSVWQSALALGAEHVVELPQADTWLAELLTRPLEATGAQGGLLAITGACGGAGASSLAVGIAAAEQRRGRKVLLIDGDFAGGGIDLILGAEAQAGTRWSELTRLSGRLNAENLLPHLPIASGIHLVSASRSMLLEPTAEAWDSILHFGQQNFDLVVVDLQRHQAQSADQWWPQALRSALWCVVPTRIRPIAAAAVCLELLAQSWASVHFIARQTERGIAASDLGRALGHPVLGTVPNDNGVATSGELGALSSGAFAKVCTQLASELSLS